MIGKANGLQVFFKKKNEFFHSCNHTFFYTALVFLGVRVIIDANEKQIASVMFQQVIVFLFLYLVDGRFRRLVVFQRNDHRRNVRDLWNQGQVGIAFARGQFLDDRIFQVGIEIGKPNGALERGFVVVSQRIGGTGMRLSQGGGNRCLVLINSGIKQLFGILHQLDDWLIVLFVLNGNDPLLADFLIRDIAEFLLPVVGKITQMY